MKQGQLEIMAPVGSYASLQAAITGGADSVYFGVAQLNMRAKSTQSFGLEDVPEITKICSEHNIKAYLTLNTIIYDHDLKIMQEIADKAKLAGVHAIIASDHAVMNYCKKNKITVHISTQANVTNIDTIAFYSVYADVMVLSRELSLQQVSAIVKAIKQRNITGPSGNLIKIEIFGHGALCMAISGKCYLSLHSNFSSANRGACIQNCRKQYIVTDKATGDELEIQNEYIMSAKDLCTLPFLDQIENTGINILKIEGRGRSADYVYKTTKCYKEAIKAIQTGTYNQQKIDTWMKELSTVFNRGFWGGYYLGKLMGEWTDSGNSKATKRKIYVGKGLTYYQKAEVAEFKADSQGIQVGDEIIIIGPTTGVIEHKIASLRVDDSNIQMAKKGSCFTFPLKVKIRPSDKLYKLREV